MGNEQSRQEGYILEAIICGREGQCAKLLKKNPKLALCEFYNGTTNPVCRATYMGHRNIVSLLVKYGADINKRS
jgi:hypothetical protein